MASERDLVRAVQNICNGVIENMKLSEIVYGKVISANPLKIQIDQKLILTKEQLVLTRNVTDYESKISIDWLTDNQLDESKQNTDITHYHALKGEHTVKHLNALKTGESVVLLRFKQGQKYLVIDRIGVM